MQKIVDPERRPEYSTSTTSGSTHAKAGKLHPRHWMGRNEARVGRSGLGMDRIGNAGASHPLAVQDPLTWSHLACASNFTGAVVVAGAFPFP